MKKIIIILLAILGLNTLKAQSLSITKGDAPSSEIPAPVEKQFKKDYPAFNPIWSKENYNYRADYTDPATNLAGLVVYDRNGRTLRSENELQTNSYPGSINDYHTNTLPKATKYRVYSAKDTAGIQSYYTTTDGDTYYFDKDGNYVSRSPARASSTGTGKK